MNTDLAPKYMIIGGRYNWRGQPERLIYLGSNVDPTGLWYQFCKVGDPSRTVWCEVRASDLQNFEVTKDETLSGLSPAILITDGLDGRSAARALRQGIAGLKFETVVFDDRLDFLKPTRKKAQWKSEIYGRKR